MQTVFLEEILTFKKIARGLISLPPKLTKFHLRMSKIVRRTIKAYHQLIILADASHQVKDKNCTTPLIYVNHFNPPPN